MYSSKNRGNRVIITLLILLSTYLRIFRPSNTRGVTSHHYSILHNPYSIPTLPVLCTSYKPRKTRTGSSTKTRTSGSQPAALTGSEHTEGITYLPGPALEVIY